MVGKFPNHLQLPEYILYRLQRIFSVQFSVNCEYEEWGTWTPCTKTCESGEKTRQRGIETVAQYGGTECSGKMKETQSCNTKDCPSTYTFAFTCYKIL